MVYKGSDGLPGYYALGYVDDMNCDSFDPSSPRFFFGIKFDRDNPSGVTASSSFSLGNNYFVVGTYNGRAMRLYVNGKLESDAQIGKPLSSSNTGDLTIGRMIHPTDPDRWPYWVNGIIDDVRIYSRALTESEISTLYTSEATK